MKTITIGDFDLKNLTDSQLMHIAKMEGVHLFYESWGEMISLELCNTMFSDTIVLDFEQKKLSDESTSRVIVFFFNFKDFCFHWHFKDDVEGMRNSRRLGLNSIKYLLDQGYDIPLY